MKLNYFPALLLGCSLSTAIANTYVNTDAPANPITCNDPRWSVMFYAGKLVEDSLLQVFSLNFGDETDYTIEVMRELSPDNLIRRYLQPLMSTVEMAGNITYRDDPNGGIYEFNPYLMFRWEHFPWDKYIVNTYAIGWGISYDTRVSTWEAHDSDDTSQLLNYLVFETTFAMPTHPQWQLVLAIHHRSGAFGLYGADNSGTNIVGLGIRYSFY